MHDKKKINLALSERADRLSFFSSEISKKGWLYYPSTYFPSYGSDKEMYCFYYKLHRVVNLLLKDLPQDFSLIYMIGEVVEVVVAIISLYAYTSMIQ